MQIEKNRHCPLQKKRRDTDPKNPSYRSLIEWEQKRSDLGGRFPVSGELQHWFKTLSTPQKFARRHQSPIHLKNCCSRLCGFMEGIFKFHLFWVDSNEVPHSMNGKKACFARDFDFISYWITRSERNSDLGMHEQTDLVELWTIQYPTFSWIFYR